MQTSKNSTLRNSSSDRNNLLKRFTADLGTSLSNNPVWFLSPLGIYTISVFLWPNAGLGNNGHCDAWYYWGMAHSPEIVSNTFAWDYYPSSRVPMYALGWIIPSTLDPILWSKLFMIISAIVPILVVLPFLASPKRPLIFVAYFLGFLIPIAFSQTSATYSGTSYGWLCATILYLYNHDSSLVTGRLFGFLSGMLLFTNIENIFFLVIFCLIYIIQTKNSIILRTLNFLLGTVLCYATLVFILLLGGLTIKESFSFPIPQFNAAIYASQNKSFFLDANSAWLVSTPLLLCHIGIIIISFCFWRKFSLAAFKALSIIALVQLLLLLSFQLLGFSIIFNNGFDALSAYWICTVLIFLCLKDSMPKICFSTLVLSIAFFLIIIISQYFVWALRKYVVNLEQIFISVLVPLSAILFFVCVIRFAKNATATIAYLSIILIPFLGIQTSDYASSFYQNGNRIFQKTYFWTSSEYRTADNAIQDFSSFLRPPTAISYFETPEDNEQTMLIRASTRSFATCSGNFWSNYQNLNLGQNQFSGIYPKRILLASSKELSRTEILRKLPRYSVQDPILYTILGKEIFWYRLVLTTEN